MKEQIIQLDAHDDFISARDKIGWAQTARVLLVWPTGGRVLTRRLDLLLLKRHAARLGAQLVLITADAGVREQAQELALPVFGSVEASHVRRGRTRGRPVTRPSPPRVRLDRSMLRPNRRQGVALLPAWANWTLKGIVFVIGLAGLAGMVAALGPSATVTVVPATEPVRVQVNLVADSGVEIVDDLTIPARIVRVEVEASGTTATTGLREVPSQPALGTVIFTSLDGTLTLIPAGTGVRTTTGAPARFRTVQAVSLEAIVGATAQAAIEAVDLGPSGNVAAGLINAIDGPLGLQLAVVNPSPTVGGALTQQAAVTNADRERLLAELRARLEAEAVTALQSQLGPSEFLAPDSVRLTETVAETFDLAVGEQADTLPLTLRLAFSGVAVDDTQARAAALQALLSAAPEGTHVIPGTEQFERFPAIATDEALRVHFTLQASGVAVPLVDDALLRELVRGQPVPQSQLRLASALPLSTLPIIEISPEWYPRLPWLPFRIDVVVAGGA